LFSFDGGSRSTAVSIGVSSSNEEEAGGAAYPEEDDEPHKSLLAYRTYSVAV